MNVGRVRARYIEIKEKITLIMRITKQTKTKIVILQRSRLTLF